MSNIVLARNKLPNPPGILYINNILLLKGFGMFSPSLANSLKYGSQHIYKGS